jgi:hypothetical protein
MTHEFYNSPGPIEGTFYVLASQTSLSSAGYIHPVRMRKDEEGEFWASFEDLVTANLLYWCEETRRPRQVWYENIPRGPSRGPFAVNPAPPHYTAPVVAPTTRPEGWTGGSIGTTVRQRTYVTGTIGATSYLPHHGTQVQAFTLVTEMRMVVHYILDMTEEFYNGGGAMEGIFRVSVAQDRTVYPIRMMREESGRLNIWIEDLEAAGLRW